MVFRLGKRPFVQGDTMAEQNRRRFYTDILVGRRSVGFKLIGLISAFLLLFFVMSYTVTSGESAPEFDEKGFLFGSIPMIYVDEVMQPLPPIKYGFADYDAEPILKKCGGFYLAKRVLDFNDLPEFNSSLSFEIPHQTSAIYDSLGVSLLLEYLNDYCLPIKDGRSVCGFYSFPTAEEILTAVYFGKRFNKKTPDDCRFVFHREQLSTRFIGSVPITHDVNSIETLTTYNSPLLRREFLISGKPDNLLSAFAWCHINNYKKYCAMRANNTKPLNFSILNVAAISGSIRIKFTPFQ